MDVPTVLIVEDEHITALDLEESLIQFGYRVVGVTDNGEEALRIAAQARPDLVVMDIRLRGSLDGIDTAKQLQAFHPIPIIYLTAHTDHETVARAAAGNSAFEYVVKPYEDRDLQIALTLAFAKHAVEQQHRNEEHRLNAILQSLGEGVLLCSAKGIISFANRTVCSMLSKPSELVLDQPLSHVMSVLDQNTMEVLDLGTLPSNTRYHRPDYALVLINDDQALPIDLTIQVLPILPDVGESVVIVIHNVSERLRAEERIRSAYHRLVQNMAILERRNTELHLLHKLASDLQMAETVEKGCEVIIAAVQHIFPNDSGILLRSQTTKETLVPFAHWGQPLNTNRTIARWTCPLLNDAASMLWQRNPHCSTCRELRSTPEDRISCLPLSATEYDIGMLIIIHHDKAAKQAIPPEEHIRLITALAEQVNLGLNNICLREVLHQQAIRDSLTGLFNRRYLEETLRRELTRAERHQYPIGLILLDLDHFKQINDNYGHQAGDTVLRAIGVFLQSYIRHSDIACRYGGEEFLLVLPLANQEVTLNRAQAIRHEIKQLQLTHNDALLPPISASIGVTIIQSPQASMDQALSRADHALYTAKTNGRDQVVVKYMSNSQ